MPRKQKKYHYIYKTTCLITGKFYIGMHSTDNLEDNYLGSGKILGYSRNKYGDENHVREILEYASDRKSLALREKEIVNEDLMKDPLNINLKYGGDGGWDHIVDSENYQNQLIKAGKNGGFANQHLWADDVVQAVRIAQACAGKITMNKLWENSSEQMCKAQRSATLAASSDISKAKRKATMNARKHAQGKNNSQFGTCWITNGHKSLKINAKELHTFLSNGFRRGRKL